MAIKIGLISLGCAKNLVNSEQMLYLLNQAGYDVVGDVEEAEAVIINTCGFIDSAKSEAIDHILALGALKENGNLRRIIVTGCLSERYRDEILQELPEVDSIVGVANYGDIVRVLEDTLAGEQVTLFGDKNGPVEEIPRAIVTGAGWAYLRIAEGCDNHCAYCVIPGIRGKYRSRQPEAILEEAKELAALGVRELIVIAQDVTRYGRDLYGHHALARLLRDLCRIDGIEWIRVHYLYPDEIDDELIDTIAEEVKIVKYLDIPIQHINDRILRTMCRRGTGAQIRTLFKTLRERIPGLVLRTSLIAGLPGEGEAEFEELCEFLREAKIERAGVFVFSPEEGTPAARMEHVDTETAQRRAELIEEIQADVMDAYHASRLGQTLRVLSAGYDEQNGCCSGRSYADSPDVDGTVYFEGDAPAGTFTDVEITDVLDGELYGKQVRK